MFAASKTASVSGGYQIQRSLRFNSADSAYLNRTPASAGNLKTWTWSGWVKRSNLDTYSMLLATSNGQIYFDNQKINVTLTPTAGIFITNAVYRDVSAWYHIVVACDTTQATATNRMKLYVNNIQVTDFSTQTAISQNVDTSINGTVEHDLGRFPFSPYYYSNVYMTEVNFIDGQQLTPSSFGQTDAQTGVWQPKAYSGSYGTNGFYLNFSDNSNTTAATLGKDYSGNGNNWTPNNFSVSAGSGNDSLVDSPTLYGTDTGVGGTVRGNYCTWNPIGSVLGAGSATNGNLDVACADASTGTAGARGTIAPTSDKWYFEVLVVSGGVYGMIGVSDANKVITSAGWGSLNAWTYYGNTGYKYGNGTDAAYGATYTTGDLIGVAYDSDAGTLTFYKNGTSQGQAFTGLTGKALAPYVGTASGTLTFTLNAGQRPFAYTAPSGYKALCTQNLPTPTIGATTATQAGKYFNPVLYTGNGSSRSITGLGFQPDFTWIKDRSAGFYHRLADAVRGVGKELYSNDTGAETTNSVNGYVTSFDSDGFSLGTGIGVNQNATTYVAWNWKANGSGSTNTAGSITSTVSANTTSGFSIVTYTGTGANATIGHGLGVAPSMIISKSRSNALDWDVYHSALGPNYWLRLNSSIAAVNNSAMWRNVSPTSTVWSIGTDTENNTNGATYVAYVFAEIAGYSKFGSWTGNGSSTGPFIFCGFRPAFVLVKNTTSAGPQWWILDNKRNTYNPEDLALAPSLSLADQTIPTCLNFFSNGFQITTTNGDFNTSGSNYIYMAIAENPFKYSLAR